jgi:hypothetical protein
MIKEGWALVKYRWLDRNHIQHRTYQGVRIEMLHDNHNINEDEVVASELSLEEAEAMLKLIPDEQRKQLLRSDP